METSEEDKTESAPKRKADEIEPIPVSAEKIAKLKENEAEEKTETEGRTDEPTVILTRVCMMHVFMMRHICHACTKLDSDAYIHYACMYYAYTYAP